MNWSFVLLLAILALFIGGFYQAYREGKRKPFRPQHHLDADPLGEALKTLRRLRMEEHDNWDAEFRRLVGDPEVNKIAEMESIHMQKIKQTNPELYLNLKQLERMRDEFYN